MQGNSHWPIFVLSLAIMAFHHASCGVAGDDVFTRRILPLAKAERPSSCRECHFAGVDLSQYILNDEASTFAALRIAGLIDVEAPKDSKLLQFIRRAPETSDEAQAKVRETELAAFEAWIAGAVKNPELLQAKSPDQPIGPRFDVEAIRYARQDRVLQSFIENIWIERERCKGCHDPTMNERAVKEHGEHLSWISPDDPAGTLATIIDHGLIDVDDPAKSLILQKPLGEVKHGGHIKFPKGSRSDQQFLRFLTDYAKVVLGKYPDAASVPKASDEFAIATGQHLRITGLPQDLGGKFLRATLHSRTETGWSERPVGSADSSVNLDNGMWQNIVVAFLSRESTQAADLLKDRQLPGGRYLVRLYLDRAGSAATTREYHEQAADLYRELEIDGEWNPGWREPKIITLP